MTIKSRVKKLKRKENLPTVFTLLNLVLGFCAIILILSNNLRLASLLIVVGFIFDILDGMTARYLGVTSAFGIELDSLADMVSFVIAPALLVFTTYFPTIRIAFVVSIFIVICGVLRLAKFNLQKDSSAFIGMPTPFFAAITISLIFLGVEIKEEIAAVIFFILASAMISPVRYPNFKGVEGKSYRIRGIIFLIILLLTFALHAPRFYAGIGINSLFWVIFLLPMLRDPNYPKKKYLIIFAIGLGLATFAFYTNATFLLVLPIIYTLVGAPLMELAKRKSHA